MAVLNVKNLPDGRSKVAGAGPARAQSIAQEVTHLLSKALETPSALSILELEGLGREHWRDVDATLHVRAERIVLIKSSDSGRTTVDTRVDCRCSEE